MRITVIGTGYLGSVHAAAMAAIGHDVLGVDADSAKVAALSAGRPLFFEPDFAALLVHELDAGRLRFTTSLTDAARHGDVHFVCVGTPQLPGSPAADLRFVDAVVEGLAPHLTRPCLVAGKSTVPVGTAARLASRTAELAPVGAAAEVAWNPEFLREGFAVADTLRPDRIVVGVSTSRADRVMRQVYAKLLADGTPYLVTDLATAELVKVSANAFLATKISFINAMADMCDEVGGDVVALADALGYDKRIGRRAMSAGLGFGGGCLPKDLRAYMARARELRVDHLADLLRGVDDINLGRRERIVDMARALVGGCLFGRRVAVLGAAFKPNSDDVRDSPGLHVAAAMQAEGAGVRVHDPRAVDNARAAFPALEYSTDVAKTLAGAALVLHTTDWRQYRELDPAALLKVVHTPVILDARNALDMARWHRAGWTIHAPGRPGLPPRRAEKDALEAASTRSDGVAAPCLPSPDYVTAAFGWPSAAPAAVR
jgi:UDPglucose 6-dehydrogenase